MDVGLTMGPVDPTFVSFDDLEIAEWNTPQSADQTGLLDDLIGGCVARCARRPDCFFGHGKMYPAKRRAGPSGLYWSSTACRLKNYDLIGRIDSPQPSQHTMKSFAEASRDHSASADYILRLRGP